MDTPIVWFLNLDADDELERGAAYRSPEGAHARRIERYAGELAALVGPNAHVVTPSSVRGPCERYAGLSGRAFCPTPFARTALERHGARPPRAPDFEVLRRVNHRFFSAHLGQTLEGADYVHTRRALEAMIDGASSDFVLKRPFGYSGRGRIRVAPGPRSQAQETWIDEALASREGLQVEPWVERIIDVGLHGYRGVDGALTVGEPTIQINTPAGAWISSRRAAPGDLTRAEHDQLSCELHRVADALADAHYFGPFGIDGFRYRARDGAVRFQPRSEINARYSMGWAVGMADFRPAPGEP